MEGWGVEEMERWRMERWRDGEVEMETWRDGEVERWRDGGVERWAGFEMLRSWAGGVE